jgi:divalent metal cation (Fe/Co/Zn/Cd) transporter
VPGSLVGVYDDDQYQALRILALCVEPRAVPSSRRCILAGLAYRRRTTALIFHDRLERVGLIGAAGFVVALFTGSLALAGFALTALLDSSASAVLVWRFMNERKDPLTAERVEQQAQAVVVVAMIAVALYVAVDAFRALGGRSHADESALGFVVATASVLMLPWLGRQKLRVAAALPSAALRGDGILTLAAAALAAITLLALFGTSVLGWWWADPVAALIIAIGLGAEGLRVAIRHRFG